HYLAALIHRPEREFHVLDLAAITDRAAPSVGRGAPTADQLAADDLHLAAGSGQTSAILDARARDAYKRRVGELRDELAQAERFNDVDRATRLREEIDFVSGELSAAYGFGARVRKAAGADEQVRKNVTNCIRNSVARISRSNPALGRHLLAAVKTGVFCAYRPERPVTWES